MSPRTIVLEVPDLADDTIRLREWRHDDAPLLAAAWRDPTVIAGTRPPDDRSERAARRWIAGCETRRQAGIALDLVVASVDDDAARGEVGLSRFDAGRRAAMAGWWVAGEARGRGLASRAVDLIASWVLSEGPLVAVLAEIAPDNVASERVAAAAGFEVLRPATEDRPGVWVRRRR